jgi:hypothetical protein
MIGEVCALEVCWSRMPVSSRSACVSSVYDRVSRSWRDVTEVASGASKAR